MSVNVVADLGLLVTELPAHNWNMLHFRDRHIHRYNINQYDGAVGETLRRNILWEMTYQPSDLLLWLVYNPRSV